MKLLTLTAIMLTLLTGCDGSPPNRNEIPAQDGFDTVRMAWLPKGAQAYILRDRVSGHCFTLVSVAYHTELRQVTDDVCGA